MAANPDTGAIEQQDIEITDDASAIAHVTSLLEPVAGPTTEPRTEQAAPDPANQDVEPVAEAVDKAEAVKTKEVEAEAAAEADEDTSPGEEDTEPPDDSVELPDTIDGLAKELGVDPAALAEHLKLTVTINGEQRQVNLVEAAKGQQLETDYRQKTADLAEQKRSVEEQNRSNEEQVRQVTERWQNEFQRLEASIKAVEGILGTGPTQEELTQLLEDDPHEFMRVKARMEAHQGALNEAKAEQERHVQETVTAQQKQFAEHRTTQQRLLVEKMPDLTDQAKLKAFEADTQSYLKDLGYSPEEIGGFFSGAFEHKQVLIIRDALKWRAMDQGKGKVKALKSLPKVTKPGASVKKPDGDKLTASIDRLKRLRNTGSRKEQEAAAVARVMEAL